MTSLAPSIPVDDGVSRDGRASIGARGDTVRELQSRIRGMQATKLDSRAVPTTPALSRALGGSMREGSVYSVAGSTSLIMSFLAGPSEAGRWCAVVGFPDFGIEAAARFGIDLDRLVLVPRPGRHWLEVVAALADVIPVVAVKALDRVSPGEASRLAARLRERGTTLVVDGHWPQTEARVSLGESTWGGLGRGHGQLDSRRATVRVAGRGGFERTRETELWLPEGPRSGARFVAQPDDGRLRMVPLPERAAG